MNSGTFLPSLRWTARRNHHAPQSLNGGRVPQIVGKPLRQLVRLQPANQPGIAVGAQDAADMPTMLMVNVRCLAGLEFLVADRTLAPLVGVDPIIIIGRKPIDSENPRPPESRLLAPRVRTPLLLLPG
jgi:hypothetical protein